MQIFTPLCMTHIVDYTTVIMLPAHLYWGKGNDLYFVVIGDMCQTLN